MDSTSIDRGGGGVCYTKWGGRQDEAANEGARVLNIPGDLATSRQKESSPASGRSSSKEVRQARREFHQSLQEDRQKRVQASGDSIKASMEAGEVQESWTHISRWYVQARVSQPPQTMEELD